MKNRFVGLIFGVLLVALPAVGPAQAAQQPGTAGAKAIPRTPDRKPDLSGTWRGAAGGQAVAEGAAKPLDLKLTLVGEDLYVWNQEPTQARGGGLSPVGANAEVGGLDPRMRARRDQDPIFHCYPPGMVRLGPPVNVNLGGSPNLQILQTPGMVTIIYHVRNAVRYIYTDGRDHAQPLELTWNGDSIGKWDGDTLVVDTIGLRDEAWLDTAGHEHSDELHVVERFRLVDADTLEVERTLTDPVTIVGSYTSSVLLKLDPTFDITERLGGDDCGEYMVRKPGFGKGMGSLMGIYDHP